MVKGGSWKLHLSQSDGDGLGIDFAQVDYDETVWVRS